MPVKNPASAQRVESDACKRKTDARSDLLIGWMVLYVWWIFLLNNTNITNASNGSWIRYILGLSGLIRILA